jgi:hypothetical protein
VLTHERDLRQHGVEMSCLRQQTAADFHDKVTVHVCSHA